MSAQLSKIRSGAGPLGGPNQSSDLGENPYASSSMIISSSSSTIITQFNPQRSSSYGHPLMIQNDKNSGDDARERPMTSIFFPNRGHIRTNTGFSNFTITANSEPFDSFPVPARPYTHQLIHHCMSNKFPDSTIRMQEDWLFAVHGTVLKLPRRVPSKSFCNVSNLFTSR